VFEMPDCAANPYGRQAQTRNQIKSQVDAAEQEARENLTAFGNQLLNAGVKHTCSLRHAAKRRLRQTPIRCFLPAGAKASDVLGNLR
jgi:hypothetical protein